MSPYNMQFNDAETRVVTTPRKVFLQPTVRMREDGQRTYMRSVPPILKTPATPNHSRARMVQHTINAANVPAKAATRAVKEPALLVRSEYTLSRASTDSTGRRMAVENKLATTCQKASGPLL